jgi:hypothetical protein
MAAIVAVAQPRWSDRTILTFSAPVEVPGTVLPAGQYVFELADLHSDRHVVEIYNEGGTDLITTSLAIPMRRTEATGDIAVHFSSTPADTPPALKGWFYPGSLNGHQFVYPAEQARKISDRTRKVVLTSEVETAEGEEVQKGTLKLMNPGGNRTAYTEESGKKPAASSGDAGTSAEAETRKPAATAKADMHRRSAPSSISDRLDRIESILDRALDQDERPAEATKTPASAGAGEAVSVRVSDLKEIRKQVDEMRESLEKKHEK